MDFQFVFLQPTFCFFTSSSFDQEIKFGPQTNRHDEMPRSEHSILKILPTELLCRIIKNQSKTLSIYFTNDEKNIKLLQMFHRLVSGQQKSKPSDKCIRNCPFRLYIVSGFHVRLSLKVALACE